MHILLQSLAGDAAGVQPAAGQHDLWTFLTPQNSLELAFLAVILTIFVAGLIAGLLAPKYWGTQQPASGLGADGAAQAFAKRWDALAQSTPGLLLTVGLLGTFIGIGLALGEVRETFDPTGESLGGMKDVLGGLGLKFKCSVWGIAANFAYRVLYIVWLRLDQRRARFVRASLRTAEDAQRERADNERAQERRAEQDFRQNVLELIRLHHAENTRLLGGLVQQMDQMRSAISTIGSSAGQMQNAAAGLSASVNQFQVIVNQFGVNVGAVVKGATDTLSAMQADLRGSVDSMTNKINTSLDKFSDDVVKTLRDIEGTMQSVTTGIKQAQQQSTRDIQSSTASLSAAVAALTRSVQSQEVAVKQVLTDLRKTLEQVSVQERHMVAAMEVSTQQSENLAEYVEKLTHTSGTMHRQTVHIFNQLADKLGQMANGNGQPAQAPSNGNAAREYKPEREV